MSKGNLSFLKIGVVKRSEGVKFDGDPCSGIGWTILT